MKKPLNHHDHAVRHNPEMRKLIEHVEDHKRRTGSTQVRVPMAGNPGMTMSTYYAVNALLEYRAYGKQSFVVGPNLQEGFCNTGLQSVPREALKMPYDCFWLALPDCPWKIWNPDTGFHEVQGAYVWMLDDDIDEQGNRILDSERLVVWIWGKPNENSKNQNDHACSWAEFSLGECYADGGDLEDYMVKTFQPHRERNDEGHSGMPSNLQESQTDLMKGVYRIAVNLMLYLQTDCADLDAPPKPPKGGKVHGGKKYRRGKALRGKFRKEVKGTVTTVAPSIEKLIGEQKARMVESGGICVWVRGHWQHYWYGSGMGRVRLPKWKLPFLRNTESDEIARDRNYDVRP